MNIICHLCNDFGPCKPESEGGCGGDGRPKRDPTFRAWLASHNDCGGGKGEIIGYYSSKEKAQIATQINKGPGSGYIEEVRCVISEGEVYLLAQPEPVVLDENLASIQQAVREKALSKLTPGERAALGV